MGHFLLSEVVAANGHGNGEAHAVFRVGRRDGTMVQFHKHPGKAQANAAAHLGVKNIGLEETVEDLVHMGIVNVGTAVGDGKSHLLENLRRKGSAIFLRGRYAYAYAPAVRSMLEGVRQEVEHNLVKVALVYPEILHLRRGVQTQVDVPGRCHIVEGLHDVPHEVYYVRLAEVQLHLTLVHLAHIHYLVHQAQDAEGIAVHEVVAVFLMRILLRFTHLLEGRHQESQRSTYLMGDVGEHLELEFLYFRGLTLLHVLLAALEEIAYQHHKPQECQAIHGYGPPGQIPRVQYSNGYGCGRILLRRTVEICLDSKGVMSGRQIAVRHLV